MLRSTVRFLATGLLFVALGVTTSLGIVIRHDRDDAKYQELGARFPAVANVLPDGTGVLVAPGFVLTAAHVARGVASRSPRVEIDGREYRVDRIYTHPAWTGRGPHDIGLLRLEKPVQGVGPVELYAAEDEVGHAVIFVGFGDFGNGLTGPKTMDGIKRGATNRVESADDDWLFFTFDDGAGATDLEGVSGPGDSGGPALITKDGAVYTLGVSVFADGQGKGPGRYGIREGYTRVSSHRDWVESILSGNDPDPGAEPGAQLPADRQKGGGAVPVSFNGSVSLPDTPRGQQVAAYIEAYNRGRDPIMLDYQTDHFEPSFLATKSSDKRIEFYHRLRDELFGKLTPQQVRAVDAESITVLFEAEKGGMAEFRFTLEPETPHRITGIRVAQVSVDGPSRRKP